MLEKKTITIDGVEITAKIMPIMIALKLKMKLLSEISPVIMTVFKEDVNIKDASDVLANHLKADTVEGIIEVMTDFVEFNKHKLIPEVDFGGRGTMFVWEVILHFLKTNYADVLDSPKIQSLIGGMSRSLVSQTTD